MRNPATNPSDRQEAYSSKLESLPNGQFIAYPTNDNLRGKVVPGIAPSARGAVNMLNRNVREAATSKTVKQL